MSKITSDPFVNHFSYDEETLQMGIHIWDEIAKGIAQKMPEQLIPVVNEVFHKEYPSEAKISFLSTEYVKPQTKAGHPYPLILSDITFQIDDDEIYHLEFQITVDKSIAIRMSEYDFQIGLQHNSHLSKNTSGMLIRLPYSAVIYPAAGSSMPDSLSCTFHFQDGTAHTYRLPIIKISDYQLSELFQKRLNMFLPFSLLRFRSRLDNLSWNVPNKNSEEIETVLKNDLTAFIQELILGLETECRQGILTQWQYNEFLRLIQIALNHVLSRHQTLLKEAVKMTECKLKFISDIVREYEDTIAQKDYELSRNASVLSQKDYELSQKDHELSQKNNELSQKDHEIQALRQQLAALQH